MIYFNYKFLKEKSYTVFQLEVSVIINYYFVSNCKFSIIFYNSDSPKKKLVHTSDTPCKQNADGARKRNFH